MAEEKQNVSIACTVIGRPFPSITWSKSVSKLPEDRNEVTNGTLTIYSVTRNEGGIYVCKAENILGSATDAALLVIFSPLKFKVRPPLEVSPSAFGSSVHLPCVAESDLRTAITCRATNALSTIEAKVKVNSPVTSASCSVIRKYVSSISGNYVIDPDGVGGLAPFTVYCDMSDKNGVGVTAISHDSESRILVDGCHPRGCYSRDIHYTDASLSQLASLTRVSSHCEQFIKYECYDSRLRRYGMAWWVSRDSSQMTYWGGASPGSGKCACGMTNSCANPSYGCNCDKNDHVWREDSGLLTDKTHLPVKQLRFGDASGDNQGYHTLGKLKCYGIA